MRKATLACAAAVLAVAATLSCDRRQPLAPISRTSQPLLSLNAPAVVISQIYGGGGNSGATLRNDFIELHNTGTAPVDLSGWSVQYASASGTSYSPTPLSGTVAAGGYYLVKEAAGTGGTVDLPTPDATGNIAMALGAGKVLLATTTTGLTGAACPTATSVVDLVSFGTTATNCGSGTTATLSNTTAAFRKDAGCAYTGNLSDDFETAAPAPRNSASPTYSCGVVVLGPPAVVTVSPDTGKLTVGATLTFTATARDSAGHLVTTTFTWGVGDATIATVNAGGVVTAVALGTTPITATSANGIVDTAIVAVAPPAIHWIDVSSSSTSFPPGFQTQLFATARTASGGTVVPATFIFEALDPTIATVALVQNTGIVTGVSASATRPRIRITATPLDGATPPYVFTTSGITIETPAPAPLSIYATNDEFGDPTAAGSSNPNDLLIVRPQYTISYNESRGTPNWVSYELDARQMVIGQDRCNCFTADPLLPADKQILTSDYTNGGFDRGHMARSADRTAGNTDNAATFYLTNIVPQMADLNQGVWAAFEDSLGDSAKNGRAVYIITGPLYSRSHGLTFLKNEGKVAVPDSTWKVAFIGPITGGVPFTRANLQSWGDLPGTTLLAVMMPNVAGVRSDPWSKYRTTVDKIEAATGYDFLSLLSVAFQNALEAGDHAPAAAFAITGTPNEGSALGFDASATTDPDLGRTDMDHAEALSYAWSFGDGGTGSGVAPLKAFGHSGSYAVTLIVTDAWGWPSVVSHDVTVADVAPLVAPIAGANLLRGETYAFNGSFTDPGTETWTATVNYGDASGTQPLALAGKTFQLSHLYATAGTYTVTVSVSDGELAGAAGATVVVLTPLQGIAALTAAVDSLGGSGGPLRPGEVRSLEAEIRVATAACGRTRELVCGLALGAFVLELRALRYSGRVSEGVAAPLIRYAERVIGSLRA